MSDSETTYSSFGETRSVVGGTEFGGERPREFGVRTDDGTRLLGGSESSSRLDLDEDSSFLF